MTTETVIDSDDLSPEELLQHCRNEAREREIAIRHMLAEYEGRWTRETWHAAEEIRELLENTHGGVGLNVSGIHARAFAERVAAKFLTAEGREKFAIELEESRGRLHELHARGLAEARQAAVEEFVLSIPVEYRIPIDPERLEAPDAHAQVMRFDWTTSRGLLAYGATGRGKTRAVCTMAIETSQREGVPAFVFVRAKEITDAVRESFNSPDRLANFMSKLYDAPALIIDDLGKGKLTPRCAEELCHLVETRTAAHHPLIITCQMNTTSLLGKWIEAEPSIAHDAAAIVRRLEDYLPAVNFGP